MIKKTKYSYGGSIKFKLPCNEMIKNDNKWLDVKGYLTSKNLEILIASLQNYKDVILKFGNLLEIQKEYDFGKLTYENNVPNFIKFLCVFSCNDIIQEIQSRNFNIHNFICKGEGDLLGIIVMPYVSLGNLDNYSWNKSNLHILKNVICQVVFALLYAYEKFQFIHGDLHVGNILLRHTKKKSVMYGNKLFNITGIYPLIMDFGRSYQKDNCFTDVYRSIDKFLTLTIGMEKSDLSLEYDKKQLTEWIRENTPITEEIYDKLQDIVNTVRIRYVLSELPKFKI